MRNIIYVTCLFMVGLPIIAFAEVPSKVKGTYNCLVIDGNQAGSFQVDKKISQCKYLPAKSQLTFRWKGQPAEYNYSKARKMTRKERDVAAYWLRNINNLEYSGSNKRFNLENFLSNASKAAVDTYVMEATINGEDLLDLVYVTKSGNLYVIRIPKGYIDHPPYDFWFATLD